MEQEEIENYFLAGKIAAQAREYGKGLIKPEAKISEVAEAVENKIKELGGYPAFPVNLSMDQTAAHDTAEPNDERTFGETVVKLDVGAHVNGYVGGDTAVTVDLTGKYTELVKASREALEAALKIVQPGTKLRSIGKEIEDTIKSYGYKPVRNLTGHGIGYETVHMTPSVPNYDNKDETEIEEGMTIAIEPFATDGMGMIHNKGRAQIHSITGRKPVRNLIVRNVLKECRNFRNMPFATRWLTAKFPAFKVNFALKNLEQAGILHSYPPLVEKGGGVVAQTEHSMYVGKKLQIMTKL